MIGKKLKHFLSLYNISLTDLAKEKNTSPQSISNKFRYDRFFISDLIEYANKTNCKVALISNNTKETILTFDIEDIKKDTD